jgi:hypothetical protein
LYCHPARSRRIYEYYRFAAKFGSLEVWQLGNGKAASRRSSEVQQLGSLATEKDKTLPPSRIFVLSSCAQPQDL